MIWCVKKVVTFGIKLKTVISISLSGFTFHFVSQLRQLFYLFPRIKIGCHHPNHSFVFSLNLISLLFISTIWACVSSEVFELNCLNRWVDLSTSQIVQKQAQIFLQFCNDIPKLGILISKPRLESSWATHCPFLLLCTKFKLSS